MIHIESLTKSYGKIQVLKEIDLVISSGETHGIVGKNGSGKTTLFKCLIGLETCFGNIKADKGQPLKNITGYLPTNPPIINKITGYEFLRLLSISRGLTYKEKELENIFDLPLNRYVDSYSTGMLKKLALQGILLQRNEIYILDEPFNGLDYQSCIIVTELLRRMKEIGKTVLISSHIFSTLTDVCDYIHYLDEGVIAQTADKTQFKEIEKSLQNKLVGDGIKKIIF